MKYAAIAFAVVLGAFATLGAQSTGQRSDDQQRVAKNIATFDDLDFNVFSHQKWDEFSKSHSKDIVVHWPRRSEPYSGKVEILEKVAEDLDRHRNT